MNAAINSSWIARLTANAAGAWPITAISGLTCELVKKGKPGAGWIGPACWPENEKSDLGDYRAACRDFGHDIEDHHAILGWGVRPRRGRAGRQPSRHGAGGALRRDSLP